MKAVTEHPLATLAWFIVICALGVCLEVIDGRAHQGFALVVATGGIPGAYGLRFDTREECLLAMPPVPKVGEARSFDGIGCVRLLEPSRGDAGVRP